MADHWMHRELFGADKRAAEVFPLGTMVRQSGHDGSFEVVGYWRGYVTLLHPETGTTHKASVSELTKGE